MKKELIAGSVILLLIAGAVINVLHLRALSSSLTEHIQNAQTASAEEIFDRAEKELRAALDTWLDADGYTHIFIRHSEIDSTSDAFYDALSCIAEQDGDGAVAACEKLQYHIDSIVSMEYVTLKSVF